MKKIMTLVLHGKRILIAVRTKSFTLLLLIQTNCSMTWVGKMMVKQEIKAEVQKQRRLEIVQHATVQGL